MGIVLGRYDRFVVTGYGETGAVQNGSFVLANEEGAPISFNFRNVDFCLIFNPQCSDRKKTEVTTILKEVGFKVSDLTYLKINNTDLCRFVEGNTQREKLVFVFDLPINRAGEEVHIGSSHSEAPVV